MLYLPDSNIFIYAKMAGMPEHRAARKWLTNTLNETGSSILCCETVLLSFLRICTNPKIFAPPLPHREAANFTATLLRRPNVILYRATADHFVEVGQFMEENGAGGDLTMDIHLALAAIETGAVLVTRDKFLLKVPYLKTLDPF